MRQLMHIQDGVNLRVSNGNSGLLQPAKVSYKYGVVVFRETSQTLMQPIADGTECAITAIG